MSTVRALGLLSGGLDSALAARMLIDQGIEVVGLHFRSPTACRSDVNEVAAHLGIRLIERDKGEAYLRLLRQPRWGYGRNMNPCVDCRHFMFRLAHPLLEELDARFLFTGEVLGQRPMSQLRDRMQLIEREAGLEGRVLRPLSAQLLPETEAERRGWVDRTRLLGINGRGRHEQLALADRYGLRHWQSPGGGCLLTDPVFSDRLRDLFAHDPAGRVTMTDVALLRLGRHVHAGDHRVVVGRDEAENRRLRDFEGPERRLVEPHDFNGPSALVCGPDDDAGLVHAAALIARYARTPRPEHRIRWRSDGTLHTRPLGDAAHAPHSASHTHPDGAAAPPSPQEVVFDVPIPLA